jgi:hypothetical protein
VPLRRKPAWVGVYEMSGDIATNTPAIVRGQRLGSFAPYKEVHVLLLYWKDADDAFYKQLHNLGLRFQSLYGYDVEEWPIDSDEPYRKLNRKLFQFLEHDEENALLILYYGGHGSINQDRHHIWLWLVQFAKSLFSISKYWQP